MFVITYIIVPYDYCIYVVQAHRCYIQTYRNECLKSCYCSFVCMNVVMSVKMLANTLNPALKTHIKSRSRASVQFKMWAKSAVLWLISTSKDEESWGWGTAHRKSKTFQIYVRTLHTEDTDSQSVVIQQFFLRLEQNLGKQQQQQIKSQQFLMIMWLQCRDVNNKQDFPGGARWPLMVTLFS